MIGYNNTFTFSKFCYSHIRNFIVFILTLISRQPVPPPPPPLFTLNSTTVTNSLYCNSHINWLQQIQNSLACSVTVVSRVLSLRSGHFQPIINQSVISQSHTTYISTYTAWLIYDELQASICCSYMLQLTHCFLLVWNINVSVMPKKLQKYILQYIHHPLHLLILFCINKS